jgi:hypothetical protein
MDEEKPFPIELIVFLLVIALANDVAEIFFDLLDFTGVGLAGEAIMEPLDFILDFFFTGIFIWRVGFGGSTITQYIDDILEILFIPGRTISVGLGIWIANHPDSAVGKIATTAASLESGNIEGGINEAEGAAKGIEGTAGAEKKLQGERISVSGTGGEEETKNAAEGSSTGESGELESPEAESGGEEGGTPPEKDVFKNPYDNPVGTAGEELNEPPEEEFHEGEGNKQKGELEEGVPSQKVIDIARRRPPLPENASDTEDDGREDLAKAA